MCASTHWLASATAQSVLERRGNANPRGAPGGPVAALGTPGGGQQDQWRMIYLIRTLALGLDPQEAIDAPAFHTNGRPPTRSGARHPPCECGPNGRTAHGFDPLAHTFNARASRPGLTRGNRTTDRSRARRRPAGRLIPAYHLEVRRDHSDRNEERSSPRTQKTRSNPHPRDPREANR
jgi:hypothetical protein